MSFKNIFMIGQPDRINFLVLENSNNVRFFPQSKRYKPKGLKVYSRFNEWGVSYDYAKDIPLGDLNTL